MPPWSEDAAVELGDARRPQELHAAPSPRFARSARSISSRVIGSSCTSAPVASRIAFAIAAAIGDDRRLAEPLRAEVRQVHVGLVDELADDLGHVGDRRHPVRVERLREDAARLRVEQALLRERVADALDDPALDLARGAERVDHAADVVDGGDPLDAHLAGLDVDGHLGDLDAEREHLHSGRVRAARALAEDLRVAEQPDDLGRARRTLAVGRDDRVRRETSRSRVLDVVALRGDLDDLPPRVGGRGAHGRAHRRRRRRAGRERRVRAAGGVAERRRRRARAGSRAPRPRSAPSPCACRCRCPAWP